MKSYISCEELTIFRVTPDPKVEKEKAKVIVKDRDNYKKQPKKEKKIVAKIDKLEDQLYTYRVDLTDAMNQWHNLLSDQEDEAEEMVKEYSDKFNELSDRIDDIKKKIKDINSEIDKLDKQRNDLWN